MCQLTDDSENPGDQDAPENTSLDIFCQKNSGHQNTDQGQQYGDSLRGEGSFCYRRFEGKDAYQCGIISNNDLGILQSDECDKKTDTYGYCVFQVHRNGVEDRFTYIGKRKQDKNDTFCKDCCKCLLPGVSHTENYCVGKVCVQSHTRSKNKWIVRQKRHQTGGNECGQCGGGEDRAAVHAGSRQDVWIDGQNISHCHKGSDSCHNLSFDICVIFFQVENFVEIHISTPFVLCRRMH